MWDGTKGGVAATSGPSQSPAESRRLLLSAVYPRPASSALLLAFLVPSSRWKKSRGEVPCHPATTRKHSRAHALLSGARAMYSRAGCHGVMHLVPGRLVCYWAHPLRVSADCAADAETWWWWPATGTCSCTLPWLATSPGTESVWGAAPQAVDRSAFARHGGGLETQRSKNRGPKNWTTDPSLKR